MKITKKTLLILLAFLIIIISLGCCNSGKSKVKKVITNELNLLKHLDQNTTAKYLSYQEFFPETESKDNPVTEAEQTFSLFFKDFDFKVVEINIDKKKKEATAIVRLKTPDSRALAKDFTSIYLKDEILANFKNTASSSSLKDCYILLNQLLTQNDYEIIESNCSISLIYQNKSWEIEPTYSLENDLVGNLITYLSDPDILSPEETLSVYFDSLMEMNEQDMTSFLGVDQYISNSDELSQKIAAALVEQTHKNFNYKMITSTTDGFKSNVEAEITTFDSEAILEKYQKKMNSYLESADAVIDGSTKRYEKAAELLLECITNNENTITSINEFQLVNNGSHWVFEDGNDDFGNAILGNFSVTPVIEES